MAQSLRWEKQGLMIGDIKIEEICHAGLLCDMEYVVECLQDGIVDILIRDKQYILKTTKYDCALLACWNKPQDVVIFTKTEMFLLCDLLLKKNLYVIHMVII